MLDISRTHTETEQHTSKRWRRGLALNVSSLHGILNRIHRYCVICTEQFQRTTNFPWITPSDRAELLFVGDFGIWCRWLYVCIKHFLEYAGSLFCAALSNTSSPIQPLIKGRLSRTFSRFHIPAGLFDLATCRPSPRGHTTTRAMNQSISVVILFAYLGRCLASRTAHRWQLITKDRTGLNQLCVIMST